ncbi:MAG: hypothetical protein GY810_14925 [Aureispira sp.]|nr:hypothetical protein [Aureispira sp.]
MRTKIQIGLYCILLLLLTQCNSASSDELANEPTKIPMLVEPDYIRIEANWGLGVHEFAWYTKLVLSESEQYIQTTGLKENIAIQASKEELLELYQVFYQEKFSDIDQPKSEQSRLVGVNSILLETKGKNGSKSIESFSNLDMHAYLDPVEDQEKFDTIQQVLKSWVTKQLVQQQQTCIIRFDQRFLEKAKPFYFRIGNYYDSYENEELMKTGKIEIPLLVGTNYYWVEWRKRPYLANKDGWIKIDAEKKEVTFSLNNKGEVICQ